jgi:hypothetical protein
MANALKVIDMLFEDLMRDGTVVKRLHKDKDGTITREEYVTHPSLLALPKLLADLGMNPAEFLITPRSLKRADMEKEGAETLGDMLTSAAQALAKATAGKKKPVDDE